MIFWHVWYSVVTSQLLTFHLQCYGQVTHPLASIFSFVSWGGQIIRSFQILTVGWLNSLCRLDFRSPSPLWLKRTIDPWTTWGLGVQSTICLSVLVGPLRAWIPSRGSEILYCPRYFVYIHWSKSPRIDAGEGGRKEIKWGPKTWSRTIDSGGSQFPFQESLPFSTQADFLIKTSLDTQNQSSLCTRVGEEFNTRQLRSLATPSCTLTTAPLNPVMEEGAVSALGGWGESALHYFLFQLPL